MLVKPLTVNHISIKSTIDKPIHIKSVFVRLLVVNALFCQRSMIEKLISIKSKIIKRLLVNVYACQLYNSHVYVKHMIAILSII